jgi:hypothetical protein
MHASREAAQNPIVRDRVVTDNRSTILYQEAGTTVTTTFFEFGGYRFPLEELTNVERVEHGGWLQTRRFELWARFRQQRVRLFFCYHTREFGQVCRALTRAREYAGLA